MLKQLKQHSIKKKIEKNLRERDISKRNSALKNLGFLIDESFFGNFEMLYTFGKEIGLHRKNIKIFTFIETKRKIPTLRHNQITNKEFSWRGEIQSTDAREFLNFPLDVLIGFYKEKHPYLEAMVSESKASFKIGFKGADERIYDLLIAPNFENLDFFKSEVVKYLKAFNKI